MTVDSMEKMLLGKNRSSNKKLVRKYCRGEMIAEDKLKLYLGSESDRI